MTDTSTDFPFGENQPKIDNTSKSFTKQQEAGLLESGNISDVFERPIPQSMTQETPEGDFIIPWYQIVRILNKYFPCWELSVRDWCSIIFNEKSHLVVIVEISILLRDKGRCCRQGIGIDSNFNVAKNKAMENAASFLGIGLKNIYNTPILPKGNFPSCNLIRSGDILEKITGKIFSEKDLDNNNIIPWYGVVELLNKFAPGWEWILELTSFSKNFVLSGKIIIYSQDRPCGIIKEGYGYGVDPQQVALTAFIDSAYNHGIGICDTYNL